MSEDTRGKDSRRRSARDSLKSGLGRLKQVIRTSSHQPEATGSAHGQSSTKNSAWAGLGTSLRALETATKLFSPLKSTIGDLATCLDVIEAAAKTRDDYEELASELKTTIDILNEYVSEFDAEEGRNSVARIVQLIQAQITHINEQREHTNTKRLLESAKDRDDVIRCYRAIEVLFRQLQNEVTLRTWRNTNKQRMMSLLRGMSPVEDARYDSKYSMLVKRGGCTPETRERILEELRNWSRDPTSAMIYWMNGMAGTGKTTIAYSLCSWLEENMLLGASFFCSRISASCRDLSQVLPTIAYQLAHYSSAYRSALCSIIEDDPDVGSRNVTRQFDKLLKEPLSKIGDAIPGVVIVIDALDECQDQNGVRLMLEVLLRLTPSMPLKFFIASRPEPSIRDKMLSSTSSSPSILHLHNIEQSIVEEDIKKYLTEALSSMFPPPCSAQIERLAKQSGKLFIYAATAARYILPDGAYVDSSARLQAMLGVNLESNSTGKHKKKYKELDMLYTTILSAALNQELLEDYELERMKRVLSMIICAKEPLSAMTIASLLQLTEQQVLSTLQPLRSVLHVSEGGEIISALHASFPDYMFDQSRSGIFYFDYRAQSVLIAHRCFDVMERELRFNICQLRSSYVLDRNVPDLQDRVNNFISVSLFYACRYWGQHLQSGNGSDLLRDILLSFLQRRLLFWMEVMNLKGYTGSCQGVILCAQNWILVRVAEEKSTVTHPDTPPGYQWAGRIAKATVGRAKLRGQVCRKCLLTKHSSHLYFRTTVLPKVEFGVQKPLGSYSRAG
ncbi:hypothetical protein FRC11_004127 [Ceratobasidium sp. 423]|nr:hypothetical protein FRC11_004127 [Ceratobasidium sp. 423]